MARQEDFLFAERALQRGYATEAHVQECLSLLERLRDEMKIEESLGNLMVKKGYLAPAQAHVLEAEIDPNRAGRPKNAIEGYRLLLRIGSGAMGSVYKADHLKLMVPVALKVLNPSLASSRTQIERLKREAQLAARLNHPNVVRSLDVGESNGFHYLAMEFVEGETVRDLLGRGRIPEKDALALVRQVASGLAHAHAHGVVHRDVKPGNIMLTPDGTAKLGDFGLARGQGPSDLTLEHASIGTPQYVAPEQMRRGSDATTRSDLFSLGATLYHMVTGRPPFGGENLGEIVQNVLVCRFEPPESLAPELSRDAVYVIDRLMRANPRERYGSAADLVADLERIGRGETVAPPDFKGDYHAFLAKRRGKRYVVLASCAVVLAAAGAFWAFQARREADRRRLAEACRVTDATRADAGSLATVEDLNAAILEMVQADAEAAAAGCPDGDVAGLRARLRTARAAKSALELAEDAVDRASKEGANYKALDRKLADLAPEPPPRVLARIAELREDIRKRSDAAAESRYRSQVNEGFRDLRHAMGEAKAFAADLETRYLPPSGEWVGHVAQAPRILEELERRWEAVKDARKRFDEALAAEPPQYGLAANAVADLRREETAALEPVERNPYLAGLSRLSDAQERAGRLAVAEQKEWSGVLTAAAKLLESEPNAAEALLKGFHARASEATLQDVEKKRREAGDELRSLAERQLTLFKEEKGKCLTYLRQRLYVSARDGVALAAASRRWVPEVDEQFRELLDRAQRMTQLSTLFVERVKKARKVRIRGEDFAGDRIERAPGEDKDLFVARAGKRTVEFRLGDLGENDEGRKQLEEILAFGPEDKFRLGWLYAAEAYRADLSDPYEAQALRKRALAVLDARDPWASEVNEALGATNRRILEGEARAQKAEAEMTQALNAHDPVKALALLNELTEPLRWTKHCNDEKRIVYFRQLRSDLERQAGRGLFLREMGVPPGQLDYGGRETPGLPAKPTSITFTGLPWHPDEGKVAKEELEQLTREYWTEAFRAPGRAPAEIAELVRRATFQLLPWGGPVETVPEGGYRPAAGGRLADTQAWIDGKERPLAIELAFPFRPDRDWSIEFEVEWPGDPGYFVVAAGRIQAVVGYQRIATRGGMAGASIVVAEDLDPGLKELGDLHWHMAKDGKPARRPTERYLDETNFVPGVPYRMRLARVDERILFEMRPAGRDDKIVPLERRDRKDGQLEKDVALADGRKVFRFLGVPGKGLAYVLREVRITGILPERASGEAKQ